MALLDVEPAELAVVAEEVARLPRIGGVALVVLVDDRVLAERLRDAFGSRLWLEIVRPASSAHQEQELMTFGQRLGLVGHHVRTRPGKALIFDHKEVALDGSNFGGVGNRMSRVADIGIETGR